MMMRALLILFFATAARSATYYIDYASGADANNGTSTSTPWKRHPYMVGFSGVYDHTAGDRFIFKGGVTWPRACFQLKPLAGGSSTTVRDYYGVTNTWHSGATWTRPIFDFEASQIDGYYNGAGVAVVDVSNFVFDNIEFKRHCGALGAPDYGCCTVAIVNAANQVLVTNCYIHDWVMPSNPADGEDGGGGGGVQYVGSGGGANLAVGNCTLHQANVAMKTGCAIHLSGIVSGCTIYEISNAYLGSGTIHDNHIYNVRGATDPLAHENAIETFAASSIYNNLIHDLESGAESILLDPGFSGSGGNNFVFNNVVFNTVAMPVVFLVRAQPSAVWILNNTLQGGGAVVRITDSHEPGSTLSVLNIQNNYYITPAAPLWIDMTGSITSTTNGFNLTNTTAVAATYGATAANYYQIASPLWPGINAGTNLATLFTTDKTGITRPVAGWDIGAYEFVPPPLTISGNVSFSGNVKLSSQ